MDRRLHIKTDPKWAESKIILFLGIFFTWVLTSNVYKTLIKGQPFDLFYLDDEGPVMVGTWIMGMCWLLYMTLFTIRNHGRKVYSLNPLPLLVQVFWAGSMMLYLLVMVAFFIDFFLTNDFRFQ